MDVSEVFVNPPNKFKRGTLLAIFSTVQFLDVFGVYCTLIALPSIGEDLDIDSATQNWIINGYLIGFASFLLFAGRVVDMVSPRFIFIGGLLFFGVLSLGAGFCEDAIALIVLKSVSGIGASVTIPSAIKLIVNMYPIPSEQSSALGIFCATGGLANVVGTIIGGLLTQADWRFCFWILAIIALPLAPLTYVLSPRERVLYHKGGKVDIISTCLLVIGVVLLIFALTTGNNDGWGTAQVIAPLVISILTLISFGYWQYKCDQNKALLPKRVWSYKGFGVLFVISFIITLWWTTTLESLTKMFIDVWKFEALDATLHFIPFGISSIICSTVVAFTIHYANTKSVLLFGLLCSMTGVIVLGFGDHPDKFWDWMVPGMVIGSGGSAINYCASNVALIQSVPQWETGLAGGVFITAQQLGSAVGISLFTVVQIAVDNKPYNGSTVAEEFIGTAAGDWFVAGLHFVGFLFILFLLPWKLGNFAEENKNKEDVGDDEKVIDDEKLEQQPQV